MTKRSILVSCAIFPEIIAKLAVHCLNSPSLCRLIPQRPVECGLGDWKRTVTLSREVPEYLVCDARIICLN